MTKKVKGTAVPILAGVSVGVGVGVIFSVILSIVLTTLILSGRINDACVGYWVMGILCASSIWGGLISTLKVKRRWLLVCMLTGGLYYLLLTIATALFFGGNYQGIGVGGAMIFMGSLLSGALGMRLRKRHGERYKSYRTC